MSTALRGNGVEEVSPGNLEENLLDCVWKTRLRAMASWTRTCFRMRRKEKPSLGMASPGEERRSCLFSCLLLSYIGQRNQFLVEIQTWEKLKIITRYPMARPSVCPCEIYPESYLWSDPIPKRWPSFLGQNLLWLCQLGLLCPQNKRKQRLSE